MSSTSPPRVQLVLSSKFIALVLLSLSLLAVGYHWYGQQQESQERLRQRSERFKAPPYFVNRGATVIRGCEGRLGLGRLKQQSDWKVGTPREIVASEVRWFLAVEDPPAPVTVAGVLMLAVHPTVQESPSFGFDMNRVELVLYQNLQAMPQIELPSPPAVPPQPDPPKPSPVPSVPLPTAPPAEFVGEWRNEDPGTQSHTKLVITETSGRLMVHAWGRCSPEDCDWHETQATLNNEGWAVTWEQGFVVRHWKVSAGDGRLTVSEHNHYTDGRDDTNIVSVFVHSTQTQQ